MYANEKGNRDRAYPAPQVFRTHPQPPVTRADANTKATKKKPNSTNKGMHLRSFCGNNLGDAKCDCGSERRSRRIGGSRSIAGRDRCASIASVRRVGDDWPRPREIKAAPVRNCCTYLAKQIRGQVVEGWFRGLRLRVLNMVGKYMG